jgi:hypothetical protein
VGQDEPEPIQPEGDDPGTEIAEGDSSAEAGEPQPEGEDPGRIETFSLEPDGEKREIFSEEK